MAFDRPAELAPPPLDGGWLAGCLAGCEEAICVCLWEWAGLTSPHWPPPERPIRHMHTKRVPAGLA